MHGHFRIEEEKGREREREREGEGEKAVEKFEEREVCVGE